MSNAAQKRKGLTVIWIVLAVVAVGLGGWWFYTQSVAVSAPTAEELAALGLGVLGPVPVPLDNPMSEAKVELGKLLFYDPRMSGNARVSCANCHMADLGWGDGGDLSLGYTNTLHWRNSQTIINSAYYQKLFWAGESLSLEAQAQSAWTGALAGNLDIDLAEERLRQIPDYVRRFQQIFGTGTPRFADALRAVATFERTINSISQSVPFDQYVRGDGKALSDPAKRGMQLFIGKAGCIQCHSGALFTDESYHNLAVPNNPQFESDPDRQIALRYQHYSRGVPEEIYRGADRDLGLYYTSKRPADVGKFRTPTLRELNYTWPYMHNGVFNTLDEVVEFYNRGGGTDPAKSPLLKPLDLSGQEVADLVAFLESLSGEEILIYPPPLPEYGELSASGEIHE